jgi:MarR family transcriptional regulator, organic hydroperoxide resistance regulator
VEIQHNNDIENSEDLEYLLNVWVLLDQTRYMISRSRELELHQFGITPEQAAVFRLLQNKPKGIAVAELPVMLLREPHSIYGLIGRMEKNSLIRKTKSPGDIKTRVVMTEKGKLLYKKSLDRTSLQMILSALSKEELDQLAELMGKLKDRASGLLGKTYKPPFLKQ